MRRWLLVLAACGPKSAPQWIEHDAQPHEHGSSVATQPASAKPVDLSKLSPATIDELDEVTARVVVDRLAGKAPAARVTLRAARLAHHRGDDVTARADLARAAAAADETDVHAEVAALAAACASYDFRLRAVGAVSEGTVQIGSRPRRRARLTILGQAIHHATEHRAQIAGALATNGIDAIDLDALDLWAYGIAEGLGA